MSKFFTGSTLEKMGIITREYKGEPLTHEEMDHTILSVLDAVAFNFMGVAQDQFPAFLASIEPEINSGDLENGDKSYTAKVLFGYAVVDLRSVSEDFTISANAHKITVLDSNFSLVENSENGSVTCSHVEQNDYRWVVMEIQGGGDEITVTFKKYVEQLY